jgi:predicted ferric reductase
MNPTQARTNRELDDLASPQTIAWALGGVAVGATVALVVLPYVTPALSLSLSTAQPKTWWYLSRASGLVAYALLALSMMLGLLLSTRFAKGWPGTATAFSLHEHASVLGLSFALFHAIVLLGDRHTPFTVAELVLPFGAAYHPFALGLGQLAFYGTVLLVGSFYVRKRIGQHAWRILHFVSFVVFVAALAHGLLAGTDHGSMLAGIAPVAAISFFGFYRALSHVLAQRKPLSCSTPPCPPSLRSTGA